jgi:hypothetical protein
MGQPEPARQPPERPATARCDHLNELRLSYHWSATAMNTARNPLPLPDRPSKQALLSSVLGALGQGGKDGADDSAGRLRSAST